MLPNFLFKYLIALRLNLSQIVLLTFAESQLNTTFAVLKKEGINKKI